MIIEKLVEYYDILSKKDPEKVDKEGYSMVTISAYVDITDPYNPSIVSLEDNDKKFPQMLVPFQESRTSGIAPYILCDKSKYVFGLEDQKKEGLVKFEKYFDSFYELHMTLFKELKSDISENLLIFLENIKNNMNFKNIDYSEEIFKKGNIVLRYKNKYVHDYDEVKELCLKKYELDKNINIQKGFCSIIGEKDIEIATKHSSLKNIGGTSPKLIFPQSDSNMSYQRIGKRNINISNKAMLKYTSALNYLLSNESNRRIIGDTRIVFWSEKQVSSKGIGIHMSPCDSKEKELDESTENWIEERLKTYKKGQILEESTLENIGISKEDIESEMYILGIYAPNAGRAAIRFFYSNSLKYFIEKILNFNYEMKLINDNKSHSSILDILKSISPRGEIKGIPNSYKQSLFNAIYNGSMYPISIYTQIINRIKVEKIVSFTRVSFIKAYLIRLYTINNIKTKEEVKVSLNKNFTDTAYLCGRLFSILEAVQPKSKIREKYFSTACTNPKSVIPLIFKNYTHNLVNLSEGYQIFYEKIMQEITSKMDKLPTTLDLEEQGLFILGYYHQKNDLFTKKDNEDEKLLREEN